MGWPDYRKSSIRDNLTKGYHEARDEKRGLWGKCISTKSVKVGGVIKGNIDPATYQMTYHLPVCPQYKQVVLNLAYGDSWFCTENEAREAGFKKAERCP